eukprot:g5466.t1
MARRDTGGAVAALMTDQSGVVQEQEYAVRRLSTETAESDYRDKHLGELQDMLMKEKLEKERMQQQYAALSAQKQRWEAERHDMKMSMQKAAHGIISPRESPGRTIAQLHPAATKRNEESVVAGVGGGAFSEPWLDGGGNSDPRGIHGERAPGVRSGSALATRDPFRRGGSALAAKGGAINHPGTAAGAAGGASPGAGGRSPRSPRSGGGAHLEDAGQWQTTSHAMHRERDSLEQFLDQAREYSNPNATAKRRSLANVGDLPSDLTLGERGGGLGPESPTKGTAGGGSAAGADGDEFWGAERKIPLETTALDQCEQVLKQKIEVKSNYEAYPMAFITGLFRREPAVTKDVFVDICLKKLGPFEGKERHLAALFKRYDASQDDFMSAKELCDALYSPAGRPRWLIGKIREVLTLRNGGVSSLQTLGRQFSFLDKSRNGSVDRDELERALDILLRGYRLALGPSDLKLVFDCFDHNKDGVVSYDEFIGGIRGKMSARRRSIVEAAFQSFDADRSGQVTLAEVAACYSASYHPKVQSGEWSETKALHEFMKKWDKDDSGTVSLDEFCEYYNWISASIDDDDYFELMIRNAWHISGGEGAAANTACMRVLVTWPDGQQTVETIKNDMGLGHGAARDVDKIRARFLEERNMAPSDIVNLEL